MIRGTLAPEIRDLSGLKTADYRVGIAQLHDGREFRLEWRGYRAREMFAPPAIDIVEGAAPLGKQVARAEQKLNATGLWGKPEMRLLPEGDPAVWIGQVRFARRIFWQTGDEPPVQIAPQFTRHQGAYRFVCGRCSATYREYQTTVEFSCPTEENLLPGLFAIWYAQSHGGLDKD